MKTEFQLQMNYFKFLTKNFFFIRTNITRQPAYISVPKKTSNDHERKSRTGYFISYNKTELHYKVKVIFFFIS